jgi:hypothetical protein
MKRLSHLIAVLGLFLALLGCGGSGGDSNSDKNSSYENNSTSFAKTLKVGVDYEACKKVTIPPNAIFVAPNGSNSSGDGTKQKPYKTIFYAISKANSGDTIVLRGGTYKELQELRIRVANITITSYPNEWAIIDRTNSGSANDWDSGIYLDVDSDGSTIECLEVMGGFYALSTETKWDWNEDDKMGAVNITVKNVKLHESYADVVKIKPNCDDFNISYSEIYNSGIGQDLSDCNAEGVDNVNADRTTASHLYIHNTCSNGIYFKGGSIGSVVEYSRIENTGEGGILLGFDTSPEFFDKAVNPNMYEAINCTAQHNLIINAKYEGIGFYASKNCSALNNTIVNCASSEHTPIYFGLSYQDWDQNAKRPPNINPTVSKNIVSQNSNKSNILYIRHSDELGGLNALSGALNIDYNCYFNKNAKITFEDSINSWQGDFDSWKTHINNDFHSKEFDAALDSNYLPTANECKDKGF